MKKIIKIILSAIGIIILCALILGQIANIATKPYIEKESQRAEFARSIERINNDCPIPAAMGKGAITGIKLESSYVTYYMAYEPGFLNVFSTIKDENEKKEVILMCFLCINAQGRNNGDIAMDALIKFGYGIRVIITESAIGRTEFSANVDEIKLLRERYKLDPHEALYNLLSIIIEADNSSLPIELDEGMIMNEYKLENDNIAIVVVIDEDLYPIEDMQENIGIIKDAMIEEGLSSPESKALLDMCKVSHTGLIYRMYGDQSHRSCEIKITSNEIRRLVQTPSTLNIH